MLEEVQGSTLLNLYRMFDKKMINQEFCRGKWKCAIPGRSGLILSTAWWRETILVPLMRMRMGIMSSRMCVVRVKRILGFSRLSVTRVRRFGLQRFDILRSLSRRDIQVIVGSGCPSLDGKVVTSGKRLRAYVNLEEGDVCSACALRASCERAYVIPHREDTAQTVDVMQILMTCAYHPLVGFSKYKLHMRKNVKASVRKLLKQVVDLSATPLDPNLPKPTFLRLHPKAKQSQPLTGKKFRRDDIEKKRGDWLCPRCDFMNFAKNNECLQCDEIRPKPKLNLGEWECPGCGFINYKRNLACHKCECNRSQVGYMNSSTESTQQFTYREWKWKKPVDWEDSPRPLDASVDAGINGNDNS